MISLTTSRLHIRPFRDDDADAAARLLDDCFGPAPRAERQAWLAWTVRNYRALAELRQPPYGDYAVTLKDGGRVVSSVGLVPSFGPFAKLPSFRQAGAGRSMGLFTPEMGLFWAVEAGSRRRGYATEASAALATYVFDTLQAERLVATTEHSNLASIGVMRKLGMTIEANPDADPNWFQTVGILMHPRIGPVG